MHELILQTCNSEVEHVCPTVTYVPLLELSTPSHFLGIISYPSFPRKILSGRDLARVHAGAKLGVSSMGAGGIIPFCRNGLGT